MIITVRIPMRRSSEKRSSIPSLMMSFGLDHAEQAAILQTASGVPPERAISSDLL